jgi:DHA1 family multidrug resistance protein-like MFS transporter
MSILTRYLRLETSIWLLAFALGISYFAGGLVSAFVMILLWKLGASFLNVGYVAALYNIALAVSSFFGGSLSARFGAKKIFIASLLFGLAGVLCYGAANLLLSWFIVALGLLFGRLAWGFRMTSSFSVISSYADKEKRATAFALVSTLGYVGAIIGPIAGGVLASLYGLFLPFLLAIPLVLVSVILIMFKLEKGEITSTRAVPSLMEVKKGVTIERGVMVLIFLVILSQFFMEFGNPYYSIFLKSELKAPEYIIGITESMLSVGALVIALPGGYLSDILHKRKPFLILGSLFATTGVGLTAFATNALMVTATYFLFGLSNTLFMTSLQAYFADVAGKYKSIVFGVYQSVAWLAGIPAPLIAGSIAENYGLRAPFMVNFIGSLTGLLLLSTLFAEKTTKS